MLPDLDAAWNYAVENIRWMLGGDISQGFIDLRGRIDIADESGTVVLIVPFSDAGELRLVSGAA